MLFARHAQSSHNTQLEAAFDIGDPLITERGRSEARQLGKFLEPYDLGVVASSPAARALQTWDVAAGYQNGTYSCRLVSHSFGELDWGAWAGAPIAEVFTDEMKTRAAQDGLDFRPPGGETVAQKGSMMYDALEAYQGDVGLVVGHGFALKSLIAVCLEWDRKRMLDFKINNCEVIDFDPFNPTPPISLFKPVI